VCQPLDGFKNSMKDCINLTVLYGEGLFNQYQY
jgi:hypothetical protein